MSNFHNKRGDWIRIAEVWKQTTFFDAHTVGRRHHYRDGRDEGQGGELHPEAETGQANKEKAVPEVRQVSELSDDGVPF